MKAFMKKRKTALCIAFVLAVLTSLFVIMALSSAAAVEEGRSFTSSELYELKNHITPDGAITFETEIFIPEAKRTTRAGAILSNYQNSPNAGTWAFEINDAGNVRLFTQSYGNYYFTDICIATEEYMGTDSNPKYVHIAVAVNPVTGKNSSNQNVGEAKLYVNGELKQTLPLNSKATVTTMFNSNYVYTNSTTGVKTTMGTMCVGGDRRSGNAQNFKGSIKSVALYKGLRAASDIAADAAQSDFSVDRENENLLFAYDLTKLQDGFFKDLSKNNNNANNAKWTTTEGRGFSADDKLFVNGEISAMPRTYEAWIYPTLTTDRPGLIIGNYSSGSASTVNFEIHSSARPSVYIKDAQGNLMDKKFNYDIRRSAWAHLVITHETLETGGARFTCYVDGVKVDSFDTELSYEFDPSTLSLLSLGGDSRSGNAQYFKGRIKDVAIYSEVLTEDEIVSSYENGVDESIDSLMLRYELDGTDGEDFISDSSGNGYDLHPIFYTNTSPATDYAYSFAIVGDTQKLVYNDAYNGTDYTSYIYDWIVKNAESKKIKFVMGMGDITDKNGVDQTTEAKGNDDGVDQTGIEWDIAVAQHNKLTDAGILYGIIQGNHENVASLDTYFAGNANYQKFTGEDIGYYSEGSLGNYYVRFTAGETKYMMIGLQYGPTDAILNWAGGVIEANPDYRVIITTHAYMFRDGTTLDINDVVPPRKVTDTSESIISRNNGDQVWTKLASQYANVFMVLSGHDPCANVIMRQDTGIHGNTVTQMLVDPQGMDQTYNYETGMVAMLYFSADGKNVQVEFISAYQTLEAQKTDATAADIIFNSAYNQFDFTIPEVKTLEDCETGYGTIPAAYANEVTYPFAVFKSDKTFVGAYGDLGAATAAAKAKGTSGHYNVLMRRDAEQNTKASGLAAVRGSITVDLGGHTLYKSAVGYIFDMYVDDNSTAAVDANGYDARGTFAIKNGNIISYDAAHPIACVNYGAALSKNYSIGFEFTDVKFTDMNGGCHILDAWESGYADTTAHVAASVLFDNCTFDYAGSASDVEMIHLTGSSEHDRVIWDVTVRGGKILAGSAVAFNTFVQADGNTNGRADKITFVADENGNYITQTATAAVNSAPVLKNWIDGDVKMHFVLAEVANGYAEYVLTADLKDYGTVKDYGFIPDVYLGDRNYPLILFKNGAFIGRYSVFANGTDGGGVMSKVKELTDGNLDGEIGSEVQIVLVEDAKATGILPNVGQILGTVVIDLNGYTLSQEYTDRPLFFTQAKNWKGMNDATFNVFGGNILLRTQLMAFNGHGTTYQSGEGYKTFHMNFEDVKFSYYDGATATTFLGAFGEGSAVYDKKVGYDVSFTDCVFDFEKLSSLALVMNANDNKITATDGSASINSIVNVRVIGGEIITSGANVDFYETIDNGSSVVFEKNANKNYTVLKISGNEISKVTNGVLTADGITSVFTRGTVSGEYVKYVIMPAVIDEYSVKTSISLWSNFVYNIYLLKTDTLASVNVDGTAYDVATLPTSNIGGVDYYLVKVDLSAKESLRDILLVLTLNTDGKSVRYSATLNVVKYSKSILGGDHSAEEKAVVSDMLSYARAAYVYFETEDAEKLALVNEILGENYDADNTPELNGSAVAPSVGLKSVTYILNATPTIRFRITGNADSYAFYVDGAKLNTVVGSDENGTYIDMDVYAYAMCKTITYTIDGVESGSYHINCYYTFVKTDEAHKDNAALINLVARFAKYCESAAAYRDSVVNTPECEHNFVNGECTKCGDAEPGYEPEDYGTMSLTAPTVIYSNYPAKALNVSFSKEDYNGEITYTTDNANVFVEDGKIYATGTFDSEVSVTVTAKTAHHEATATVKVSTYNGGISAEKKIQYYEANVIKEENKGGMIFVGDSYVDGYTMEAPPFWRDFYRDFAGEKAFLMGLSSSQIHQLEIASERIVYPMEPSEIVVNIGHNDLHHGSLTVDQFVERLTALFNEYHTKLPEAKIYFFSVAPKKIAETNADRYVSSFEKAPAANAAIKALADTYDWLYFVDTTDIFYSNGENLVNSNMFPTNDNSHPSLIAYDLMKIALNEVRGVEQKHVSHLDTLSAIRFKDASGNDLTGDFAISGKLAITQLVKNNAHIHFRFHQGYRFVFWDQSNDGVFGAGYLGGGTVSDKTAGVALYDANEGIAINWTVITKDGKAYWYINGQLVQTFNSYTPEYFLIGGSNVNSIIYDVELDVRTENETAYNEHVARYSDSVVNLETYGYIPITNKVFTDASGNALTDNYIIKGKLDITDFPKDNVYIQFVLRSGYRFLLWDSNNDGKFGAGYTENNSHTSDTAAGIKLYNANGGLTLDWAVVVNNSAASFYINGEFIKRLEADSFTEFKIGASQMDVMFSDIELYVMAEDQAAYDAEHVKYADFTIDNVNSTDSTNITNTGKNLTDASGNALTNNYIAKGTLTITDVALAQAHLQFRFGQNCRFLLWDATSDGVFGAGYMYGSSASDKTDGVNLYDANGGLTLEWAIVMNEGVAYWYLNGELVQKMENPKLEMLNIGALKMNVAFYNTKVYTKAEDAGVYATELAKFSGKVIEINMYGNSSDITGNGHTFTYIDSENNEQSLTENYVIRGKLNISKLNKSNAHVQFSFNSKNRFLIWDSNSDGMVGVGYCDEGTYKNEVNLGSTLYDATGSLTFDFAIVMDNGVAYWYLNGELAHTFNFPTNKPTWFNIGVLQANIAIYDIELYVKAVSPDEYSSVVAEYLG